MKHFLGCHEWCNAHWCYAVEVDEARVKYDAQAASIVAPSLPPTATTSSGAEVPIQYTTEVINSALCHLLVSQSAAMVSPTLTSIATVTGGTKVCICATAKVINSNVQIRTSA